jgi:hypothetical protein
MGVSARLDDQERVIADLSLPAFFVIALDNQSVVAGPE